jgi:NodT family efflux transporter outer membrane factor (OMF) lipoprotein
MKFRAPSAETRVPTVILAVTALACLTTACTVGPAYVRPTVEAAPPAFKEATATTSGIAWMAATPADAAAKGDWWTRFQDPQLDALEKRVDISSQTIQQAAAQFQEARALYAQNRAAYAPTITADPSITRQRLSGTRSNQVITSQTVNQYVLPIDASYEVDVWGRVRQSVAAGRANMQAGAADLETVRLSVHAEVATDYLQIRALDAEAALLQATIEAFQKALDLTTNRYNAGVASRSDVAQAQAQLEATRADAIDLGVQRAQLEHALAVLVGELPSSFSIPAAHLGGDPPLIPVALPSALLQRRPDIAAAERRVASANAEIGVATAAFFPSLLLSASGGFQSSQIGQWLSWPSRFWSLGPALAQTLFDGGARRAVRDQAKATYDQTVAEYRQSVLMAFQDVEDNLAALRILTDEAQTEQAAVAAAHQALEIAMNQYRGGLVSYLQVTTAQSAALTDERASVNVLARRYTASVQLVKALGGGWDVSSIPQH